MNWLTFLFPRQLYRGSSPYSDDIQIIEAFGRTNLLVNGITQTGRYPHALFHQGLRTLVQHHRGSFKHILVFGIGGGDVFHLLHSQYPAARITGVDIDEKIVYVAKKFFRIADIPGTEYVIADAKKYAVEAKKKKKKFDSIIVDIYIGNTVPEFVTMTKFLEDIRQLLRPKGSVMLNYFIYTDQSKKKGEILNALQHIYSFVEMKSNYRNIFYYCRR